MLAKQEVKKHIATIQCANTLSLLQRKISNALLFHAYPNLKKTEEYLITVRQLCHFIDYNGNNYDAIKEALKDLIATVIEWNLFDDLTGEEDWTASSILASVRIKGTNCYYSYSPRMRDLLSSPSIYAKINLVVQSKFKSAYGLALYENCVRYQGIPQTKWFDFDAFKKLMGVPKDTYPIFRDFKRRVLEKSVEEVNTYSDLFIQPEIERAGRKVIRIRFKLSLREKKKWMGVNLMEKGRGEESNYLIAELTQKFKVDKNKAQSLVEKYGSKYLEDKIQLIESSNSYKKNEIKNITGYFLDALKNDYQKVSVSEVISQKIREEDSKKQLEKIEKQKKELLQIKYDNYITVKYKEMLDSLTCEKRNELLLLFENYLKENNYDYTLQSYKKMKLESKFVTSYLKKFIDEKHSELAPKIVTYEEFCRIDNT